MKRQILGPVAYKGLLLFCFVLFSTAFTVVSCVPIYKNAIGGRKKLKKM